MNYDDAEKAVIQAIFWTYRSRPDQDYVFLRSDHELLIGIVDQLVIEIIDKLDNGDGIIHLEEVNSPENASYSIYKLVVMDENWLKSWATEVNNDNLQANSKQQLHCGFMQIDLNKGTLRWGHDDEIEIQVANKPFQMLCELVKNCGEIVKYRDLARKLDISSYHESVDDKELAIAIQAVKRDLKNVLVQSGMSTDKAKALVSKIRPIKNTGYKLAT